jgi:putative transposase
VVHRIDRAYDAFFANPGPVGKPDFQRKYKHLPSLFFRKDQIGLWRTGKRVGYIYIPFLDGQLKLVWPKKLATITYDQVRDGVTVTLDTDGRWHLGIQYDDGKVPVPTDLSRPPVGVDRGITRSVQFSTSTDDWSNAPKPDVNEARRKLKYQRWIARQDRTNRVANRDIHTNRREKNRIRLARCKKHEANQVIDWQHKFTTEKSKNHGIIGVEKLHVQAMTKSAKGTAEKPGKNVRQKAGLNREMVHPAPGRTVAQLVYKTGWYGSVLELVPAQWTSRRCHRCWELGLRCGSEFTCTNTECRYSGNADYNAAKVIEALAVAQHMGNEINLAAGRVVIGRGGMHKTEFVLSAASVEASRITRSTASVS